MQDTDGFLWFGTEAGLNRYDGYQFKHFLHDSNDPTSISDNSITALWQDNQGFIWVGTAQGLNRFDPKTNQFSYVQLDNSESESSNKKLFVKNVIGSNNGLLWVGSVYALYQLNTNTGKVNKYTLDAKNSNSISDSSTHSILVDRSGRSWIGTAEGLNLYNPATNDFTRYLYGEGYSKKSSNIDGLKVNAIFESKQGQIWAGTESGLYLFDSNTDRFNSFTIKNGHSDADLDLDVSSIVQDGQGHIWLGTKQSGLCLLYTVTQECQLFKHEKNNEGSLNNSKISDLYLDQQGRIWVASFSGLNYFYSERLFSPISNSAPATHKNNDFSGKPAVALMYDKSGSLWASYYDYGIVKYDKEHQVESIYQHNTSDEFSIGSNRVIALTQTKDGVIWVGTHGKGLYQFSSSKNQFRYLPKSPPIITGIVEDNKGEVWVGSIRSGLLKFDRNTGEFTQVNEKYGIISSINRLYLDHSGRLWVGTWNGFIKIDVSSNTHQSYSRNADAPDGLSHDHISSFFDDGQGSIWIGTLGGGLNQFSLKSESFIHYSKKDGLANDRVLSVVADSVGDIWAGTISGLSKFNRATQKFDSFYIKDGLLSNDFNPANAISESGEIALGNLKGIQRFYPDTIRDKNIPQPLVFTDFKLFNSPVSVNKTIKNSSFTLQQSVQSAKEINLTYKESLFSFDFAVLNSVAPDRVKYAYKLSGWDNDWIVTDHTNRIATYTNIPHGDYRLDIKATDKNGDWREDITSLKLTISPPFWKTNLAYFVYFIIIFLSVYLLLSIRTRSLVRRALVLEQSVKTRTLELAKEKETVEQLLVEKNEEFSNISHEFRTPLTLILGPIAQLLASKREQFDEIRSEKSQLEQRTEELNRLDVIQRNGFRLLRMVDQLLDMEAFKSNRANRKLPQAIGETIRLIIEAFQDISFDKKVELVTGKIDDIYFDFIPDAIEKITLNLVSNAIKYTPPGGKVYVSATRINQELYEVSIEDTGIGISEGEQTKIFKRFHRVIDKGNETITGAGIGLSLVKRLVEYHDGSISLTSQLGVGTKVVIQLPIINEVEAADTRLSSESIRTELVNLGEHDASEEKEVTSNECSIHHDLQTLLIIEDNTDMLEYMRKSLVEHYHCLTAKNGLEGIELAKKYIPDLIISDVMMPKMDGFEAIHHLRKMEETSHIPIILLTARGDRQSRLKGWSEKADEYLTKPFDTEELIIRIRNLLGIREILKKRFNESLFTTSDSLSTLNRSSDSEDELSDTKLTVHEAKFFDKLNVNLAKNYSNSDFRMVTAASEIGMSERQLHRKLKAICDMTPSEYLRQYRLDKAKSMLENGSTISIVALEAGFSSHSYFGKCFKAKFGLSPTEFVRMRL
ncbi:two-component regulator propeller domain-containing protein [Pleionea sp. CnH1-48]|uniref:hybrid sensor histidine kinase/response regulator transcription factor n=1 Tax=Pleionea sp. CnH1-48 TaxID=2954494 RepID=UPI00209862DB|nr:two-component regulator propeller domain-containing protein [Pleionea sp. CnH1-48]MCO7224403.1 response regulator [Pleionea sp. CnH1-48]